MVKDQHFDHQAEQWDVIIIGAGMAGLTAAKVLAGAGKKVLVLEKAEAGGRAITTGTHGALLNLGAHAIYPQAADLLRRLGVQIEGGTPRLSAALLFRADDGTDRVMQLLEFILSSHLKLKEKMELIRFYSRLRHLDTASLRYVDLQAYLRSAVQSSRVRSFVNALARVASYCDAPHLLSAEVAIQQIRSAKVIYPDHGWGSIVRQLRTMAEKSGAVIRQHTPAVRIEGVYPGMSVITKDGNRLHSRFVLSTAAPQDTQSMLDTPEAAGHFSGLLPVYAACLDLVMDGLPLPKTTFATGIDRPYYFSNHSAAAKLTESEAHSVIHVLKYESPEQIGDPEQTSRELEQFLDLVQPGWRSRVIFRRFLPHMLVSHALPAAARGGLAGRPGVEVTGKAGLYIAGDWVGHEGMLLQTALASAWKAAQCIMEKEEGREG